MSCSHSNLFFTMYWLAILGLWDFTITLKSWYLFSILLGLYRFCYFSSLSVHSVVRIKNKITPLASYNNFQILGGGAVIRAQVHTCTSNHFKSTPPPKGLPWWLTVKSACRAEDLGSISGLGSERSPGEGNGNSLQISCLENPMDGGAWQATVQGLQRVRYD